MQTGIIFILFFEGVLKILKSNFIFRNFQAQIIGYFRLAYWLLNGNAFDYFVENNLGINKFTWRSL
ncbi:MAG: hypothetical protein DWQ05_19220 [Calditrichaeota bacterium]|nr:MAG: hypothetical protein DWQ05_19220 [Calditrichota bacterium]